MEKKSKKASIKYHGLVNQGATCYLNSVLQVLFMTKDFRAAVKRHTSENPDTECIDRQLRTLFADLKKRTAHTNEITQKLGIIRVREQQDAAEYFEEILRLTGAGASQIFRGLLTHKNFCSGCSAETDRDEPFWNLPVALVDFNSDYSVVEGIKDYFRLSEFSGENQIYCNKCQAKSDATIKRVIKHHPKFLMLLLKRFEFNYSYMTYVKINCTVEVPFTLQIPENQTYELYAVVDHVGSLRGGHYTATIKDDEGWYKFDDSRVTLVDNFEKSSSAYLLFYRKMNVHLHCVPAADTQDTVEVSAPQGIPPATTPIYDQCQDAGKKRKREEAEEAEEEGHERRLRMKETVGSSEMEPPPELCDTVKNQDTKLNNHHESNEETNNYQDVHAKKQRSEENVGENAQADEREKREAQHVERVEVQDSDIGRQRTSEAEINDSPVMSDTQRRVMDVKTDIGEKTEDDKQPERKGKSLIKYHLQYQDNEDNGQDMNEDLVVTPEVGQDDDVKPVSVQEQGDEVTKEEKTGEGEISERGKLLRTPEAEINDRHEVHDLNKDEMSDTQRRVMDVKTDIGGKTEDDKQSERKGKSLINPVECQDNEDNARQDMNEDLGVTPEVGQDDDVKPVSVQEQGDEVTKEEKTGEGEISEREKLLRTPEAEINDRHEVHDLNKDEMSDTQRRVMDVKTDIGGKTEDDKQPERKGKSLINPVECQDNEDNARQDMNEDLGVTPEVGQDDDVSVQEQGDEVTKEEKTGESEISEREKLLRTPEAEINDRHEVHDLNKDEMSDTQRRVMDVKTDIGGKTEDDKQLERKGKSLINPVECQDNEDNARQDMNEDLVVTPEVGQDDDVSVQEQGDEVTKEEKTGEGEISERGKLLRTPEAEINDRHEVHDLNKDEMSDTQRRVMDVKTDIGGKTEDDKQPERKGKSLINPVECQDNEDNARQDMNEDLGVTPEVGQDDDVKPVSVQEQGDEVTKEEKTGEGEISEKQKLLRTPEAEINDRHEVHDLNKDEMSDTQRRVMNVKTDIGGKTEDDKQLERKGKTLINPVECQDNEDNARQDMNEDLGVTPEVGQDDDVSVQEQGDEATKEEKTGEGEISEREKLLRTPEAEINDRHEVHDLNKDEMSDTQRRVMDVKTDIGGKTEDDKQPERKGKSLINPVECQDNEDNARQDMNEDLGVTPEIGQDDDVKPVSVQEQGDEVTKKEKTGEGEISEREKLLRTPEAEINDRHEVHDLNKDEMSDTQRRVMDVKTDIGGKTEDDKQPERKGKSLINPVECQDNEDNARQDMNEDLVVTPEVGQDDDVSVQEQGDEVTKEEKTGEGEISEREKLLRTPEAEINDRHEVHDLNKDEMSDTQRRVMNVKTDIGGKTEDDKQLERKGKTLINPVECQDNEDNARQDMNEDLGVTPEVGQDDDVSVQEQGDEATKEEKTGEGEISEREKLLRTPEAEINDRHEVHDLNKDEMSDTQRRVMDVKTDIGGKTEDDKQPERKGKSLINPVECQDNEDNARQDMNEDLGVTPEIGQDDDVKPVSVQEQGDEVTKKEKTGEGEISEREKLLRTPEAEINDRHEVHDLNKDEMSDTQRRVMDVKTDIGGKTEDDKQPERKGKSLINPVECQDNEDNARQDMNEDLVVTPEVGQDDDVSVQEQGDEVTKEEKTGEGEISEREKLLRTPEAEINDRHEVHDLNKDEMSDTQRRVMDVKTDIGGKTEDDKQPERKGKSLINPVECQDNEDNARQDMNEDLVVTPEVGQDDDVSVQEQGDEVTKEEKTGEGEISEREKLLRTPEAEINDRHEVHDLNKDEMSDTQRRVMDVKTDIGGKTEDDKQPERKGKSLINPVECQDNEDNARQDMNEDLVVTPEVGQDDDVKPVSVQEQGDEVTKEEKTGEGEISEKQKLLRTPEAEINDRHEVHDLNKDEMSDTQRRVMNVKTDIGGKTEDDKQPEGKGKTLINPVECQDNEDNARQDMNEDLVVTPEVGQDDDVSVQEQGDEVTKEEKTGEGEISEREKLLRTPEAEINDRHEVHDLNKDEMSDTQRRVMDVKTDIGGKTEDDKQSERKGKSLINPVECQDNEDNARQDMNEDLGVTPEVGQDDDVSVQEQGDEATKEEKTGEGEISERGKLLRTPEAEINDRHEVHDLNKDEMSDTQRRVMDVKTDIGGKTEDDKQSERKGKSLINPVECQDNEDNARQDMIEDLGVTPEVGQDDDVSVQEQGDEVTKDEKTGEGEISEREKLLRTPEAEINDRHEVHDLNKDEMSDTQRRVMDVKTDIGGKTEDDKQPERKGKSLINPVECQDNEDNARQDMNEDLGVTPEVGQDDDVKPVSVQEQGDEVTKEEKTGEGEISEREKLLRTPEAEINDRHEVHDLNKDEMSDTQRRVMDVKTDIGGKTEDDKQPEGKGKSLINPVECQDNEDNARQDMNEDLGVTPEVGQDDDVSVQEQGDEVTKDEKTGEGEISEREKLLRTPEAEINDRHEVHDLNKDEMSDTQRRVMDVKTDIGGKTEDDKQPERKGTSLINPVECQDNEDNARQDMNEDLGVTPEVGQDDDVKPVSVQEQGDEVTKEEKTGEGEISEKQKLLRTPEAEINDRHEVHDLNKDEMSDTQRRVMDVKTDIGGKTEDDKQPERKGKSLINPVECQDNEDNARQDMNEDLGVTPEVGQDDDVSVQEQGDEVTKEEKTGESEISERGKLLSPEPQVNRTESDIEEDNGQESKKRKGARKKKSRTWWQKIKDCFCCCCCCFKKQQKEDETSHSYYVR